MFRRIYRAIVISVAIVGAALGTSGLPIASRATPVAYAAELAQYSCWTDACWISYGYPSGYYDWNTYNAQVNYVNQVNQANYQAYMTSVSYQPTVVYQVDYNPTVSNVMLNNTQVTNNTRTTNTTNVRTTRR